MNARSTRTLGSRTTTAQTTPNRGTITCLDTSERSAVFLLTYEDGRSYRLSARAKTIVEGVWNGDSFVEIAQSLTDHHQIDASPSDVERFYEGLLHRFSETPPLGRRSWRSGHLFRLELIGERSVQRFARLFTALFSKLGITMAAFLILATFGYWILTSQRRPYPVIGPDTVAVAYGLFLVSMLLHELGHASSSMRFGARPGPIGFTLYLVFPALFSNVSSVWKLPRRQRVVVDIGGSYLQLLFGVPFALVGATYANAAIELFLMMLLGSTVFNLNPIFKFDGYWVVSDALGVTNLSGQVARIAKWVGASLMRLPREQLPWRTGTLLWLLLYSVVAALAWSYFCLAVGWQLLVETQSASKMVSDLVLSSRALSRTDAWKVASVCLGIAGSLFLLVNRLQWAVRVLRAMRPRSPK